MPDVIIDLDLEHKVLASTRLSQLAFQTEQEIDIAMSIVDQATRRLELTATHLAWFSSRAKTSQLTILALAQEMDTISPPAAMLAVIVYNHLTDIIRECETLRAYVVSAQHSGAFNVPEDEE